jgi:hypothetical protein
MDVLEPFGPVSVGGGGSTRTDAGLDVFLCKAEITPEIICELGVQSLKEVVCG